MHEKPSTARIALKWGAIIGGALVLYYTVAYVANLSTNTWLGLLLYVIMIVGIVLAMREYRTLNNGYMTYGEGIGLGALTSAVSGFIGTMYNVLYTTVIDPGVRDRIADLMREQLEDQGQLSDEQIDQAVEIAQSFQSPGLLFFSGVFFSVLIGVLLSLIIAAFMRRNKTNPFE